MEKEEEKKKTKRERRRKFSVFNILSTAQGQLKTKNEKEEENKRRRRRTRGGGEQEERELQQTNKKGAGGEEEVRKDGVHRPHHLAVNVPSVWVGSRRPWHWLLRCRWWGRQGRCGQDWALPKEQRRGEWGKGERGKELEKKTPNNTPSETTVKKKHNQPNRPQ